MKHGLLLVNIGTPHKPDAVAVRQYLRQFLADSRVISLPTILRYLLLYFVILPFRPKLLVRAYQSIWTDEGSPLLKNSQRLLAKLQKRLGDNYQIALGMRYGNPSISTALQQLSTCETLTILPLYPQYSLAATGSSIETILSSIAKQTIHPFLKIIRDFHQHPSFITAYAELIKPYLLTADHILFSYHGVPEQHILQAGCQRLCKTDCPPINDINHLCYRAQCNQTTQKLAKILGLSKEYYSMTFQSRLGKTSWIKPYTDLILPNLIQQGIKHLAIVCPSFIVDCLETLEEIGIRTRSQWQALGGEQLTLIPCLNDSEPWIDAVLDIINNPM